MFFSDCPQLEKGSTSLRILLNTVTKLVDFPEGKGSIMKVVNFSTSSTYTNLISRHWFEFSNSISCLVWQFFWFPSIHVCPEITLTCHNLVYPYRMWNQKFKSMAGNQIFVGWPDSKVDNFHYTTFNSIDWLKIWCLLVLWAKNTSIPKAFAGTSKHKQT